MFKIILIYCLPTIVFENPPVLLELSLIQHDTPEKSTGAPPLYAFCNTRKIQRLIHNLTDVFQLLCDTFLHIEIEWNVDVHNQVR